MSASTASPQRTAALGGPYFLSTPVLTSFVVLTVPIMVFYGLASPGGLGPWLLLGLCATAAVTALLIALRRWLSTDIGTTPLINHLINPLIAVLVYFAAGTARSALVLVGNVVGTSTYGPVLLPGDAHPLFRVLSGGMGTVVVMSLTEVIVAQSARHRDTVAALTATREHLVIVAATMTERLAVAEAELASQTDAVLSPAMNILREKLSEVADVGPAESAIANDLTEAVARVVRPLSHSLVRPDTTPGVWEIPPPPQAPSALSADSDVSNAVRPALLVGICELISLVTLTIANSDARLYVVSFVGTVVSWVALQVMAAVWPRERRPIPLSVELLTLAVVYVTVYSAAARIFDAASAIPLNGTILVFSIVLRVSLLTGLTLLLVLAVRRRRLEAALAESNHELESLVSSLRRQVWLIRRRMALTLHGPVQSALLSSAMVLARDGGSAQGLSQARDRIELALAQLAPELQPPPHLDTAISELIDVWRDTTTITATISDDARAHMNADLGLVTVTVEIVREAVSNAVRHGGATSIDIHVMMSATHLMRVQVDDNGCGPALTSSPGLGSMVLDEIATQWCLERTATGASLLADLQ